jgi:hypothetical protein
MLGFCGGTLICFSFLLFLVGFVLMLTRGLKPLARAAEMAKAANPPAWAQRPQTAQNVEAQRQAGLSRAPAMRPTMPAATPSTASQLPPMRQNFENAQVGQNITVNWPGRGPVTGTILGSIKYTELWQRSGSQAWVPTGNTFTAHGLGNFLIYEWQDRLYLFEEYNALTDQDVQQSFMPYAKKFAQSNQTAKVTFDWPPASWTITDIGKFSVASTLGTGLRLSQGAVGRFIHAAGSDNRALVMEDYQEGGGGQDTVWIGYSITWDDITKVG